MTTRYVLLLALALLGMETTTVTAQLQPARLFADGMVLQRNVAVPVWGQAEPGTAVTVAFDGETKTSTTGSQGQWRVKLSPRSAGGPYEMTIRSERDTVRVQDVMVGDVWVASGQSNMEWIVADAKNAETEIARADDPEIRHFKIPTSWAEAPAETLAGGQWRPAVPEHVGDFTAVGYFFARELRQHVDVPIGLVNSTWGGTRIEPWMTPDALGLDSAGVEQLRRKVEEDIQRLRDQLREQIGSLPSEDRGIVDGEPHWAAPDLDDSDWQSLPVPALWEEEGYEGMDGVAWYRTSVELSEAEADQSLQLQLGPVDDNDVTWVNGQEVGRTEGWSEDRSYEVPASLLHSGENVIVVRVEDTGGGGGLHGDPDDIALVGDGLRHSLAGSWKFKVGQARIDPENRMNEVPTYLYNKMIHPLLSYPIEGVLWYQGESNAYPEDAYRYRSQFKRLITHWREAWENAAERPFPFLFVQLANYMKPPETPSESDWAMLRESQSATLSLPKTAQAVTIDIGEADDIHPRNKQDVGRRLARAARQLAYDEDLTYSGPVYEDHRVEDGRVILSFDHVGEGLTTKDGASPKGFAIAGSDSTFVWADARIEGDQVVVWSDEVDEPVAVRYAWADNPERANLYNEAGLPAAPFRTDEW